ncbi:hypothetical protein [Flavobacterium cerinum]|uniref:Uncharacterized protein n=1 Tax=Flavobacterium cerinum TaxID=2502784 RepID=A0A3S3S6W5_9FLAO|nr:hypothetical protein [Flavobacterium cerinum]RWW91635.1 hypothetical protein EPI11_18740 [Flavobacterium cerinum]
MKKQILVYISIIALFSCKSQKDSSTTWGKHTIETPCPPKSECNFEVLQNKSLLIKTDDTNHIYYHLENTPGKTVVKYTYKTITDPKLKDAGYSEDIIFETDNMFSNLNLTDIDIQKTKMLFGVHCFCRGKAGFYKIEKGNMSYTNKKLHIELPDVIDNQKTKTVSVSFK